MKIRKVEPLHIGQFMYARIETDEGLVGYGEAGAWGHVEASATAIRRFAAYLEGRDAFAIEHHWNVMHRFGYFQGIAINAGISAIDIALWDIKGKAFGTPIHQLLGGPVRRQARVYGHIYESTIERIVEECQAKVEAGFNALGHLNPFLDEDGDQVYFKPHVAKMDEAIDNVRRMREAVGQRADLLIELHRRLTPAEAITFGRGIEAYRPLFIEDPIRPENPDAMARVAGRMPVPIATGERFHDLYQFQALLARGGVEYARVSPCVCGGITGARKIAALAEAHNVQLVPHNPLSPIGLAACLQLVAATPNFAVQEYATGFEAGVFKSTPQHLGSDIVNQVPRPRNGFVDIPQGAGLGIELLAEASRIRPPLVKPIGMRPHLDGFVVDQ